MTDSAVKTRAQKRAENRIAQLHAELARYSNDPLRRISSACDFLRAAMAVSPIEEQTAVADEMVPVITTAGFGLMQRRTP